MQLYVRVSASLHGLQKRDKSLMTINLCKYFETDFSKTKMLQSIRILYIYIYIYIYKVLAVLLPIF